MTKGSAARLVRSMLAPFGTVLLVGGIGHSSGVLHLYLTSGVPDANRVLVDVWVGQAQLIAGALYLAADRQARRGHAWRALAMLGAMTVGGYSAAMLPVLFVRAPVLFRIPVLVYLLCAITTMAALVRPAVRPTPVAGAGTADEAARRKRAPSSAS